jgi:hypothetical protein
MAKRASSNKKTIAKVGSRGLGAARGFERAKHDYYPTAAKLTRALLEVESLAGGVWEPACGNGAMSRIIKARGVRVVSADLIARGYGQGGHDFLQAETLRAPNIVTNPPFNLWQDFAYHALQLGARKVILLGRLLLLEGWDRSAFFTATRLTRAWVVGRAKMLPPGAKDKGHSGMIAFAWFVWDRDAAGGNYTGPRIGWKRPT